MIVLPVRLTEMLNDVDGARAATLALDFAEHAADLEAEALTEDLRAATVEYVAAAREAIASGRATDRLVRAYESFFAAGWKAPGHSEFTSIHDSAVRFACQDMLIEAGALNKIGRTRLTCQYIARSAQSIVGSRSAERAAEGVDRRKADRAARWEEARWQIQHVIATEPNPHE
ncbi:hypothetical protein [Actinacidiphila bryophytorum]|nr:hypothetical protein [Actinacidiphila bryophytorum]MBM9435899.1 hypothetical protein [Actinacidiphila bryophytorum]MBN6544136.1 hypothetical protein [Actinacidiphila bryophytorum]